jgi:integrase/recombinase XerD
LRSFSDDELRRIISFHPKTFAEFRLHALLLTLIDTGCRIDELLSLTRQGINFDSLFIIVKGKGSKERIIPISFELRKTLYRFLKRHTFDLVFPSRNGTKLNYQNVYRDFEILCKRIRIEPAGFHTLRRTYAKNYLRNGGNLFYLQSTMGHSRLETTRGYVEVEIEALKETHLKTSILSRLR